MHEYIPTQWLPSLASAALYGRFGDTALAWERATGISLLFLGLLLWATTLARLWIGLTMSAVALFAAWPALTERPQLAGLVLLVPVLAAWLRTASDHRPRWWLIPYTWVAAATHGIWATGAALGALVAVTLFLTRRLTWRESRHLFILLAGCAMSAALTPVGPRLLLTPFTVSSQGREFVQEWMPSSVRSPHVLAALLLLFVAWLGWLIMRRRPPAWQIALWLAAVALALSMERTVAIAAMGALPLACTAAERAVSGGTPWVAERSARLLWAGSAILGIALAAPMAAARAGAPAGVPTALRSELALLPAGSRILVDSDTSGWLMFFAPHLRPVYDLRVESYSPRQVRGYISMTSAQPGWPAKLSASGATTALVREDAPIREALMSQAGWQELGHDAGLVLMAEHP
jgi:hypothetical protein